MTRLIVRLLLTVFLVPAVAVLTGIVTFVWEDLFGWVREETLFAVAFSAGSVAYCTGFFFVWCKAIRWDRVRRRRTLLYTAFAVGVMIIQSYAWILAFDRWYRAAPGLTLVNGLLCLVWIVVCLFIWRESPRERVERLAQIDTSARRCPVCKYDLTGLSNLTCPECGAKFTLGTLLDEHRRAVGTHLSE